VKITQLLLTNTVAETRELSVTGTLIWALGAFARPRTLRTS
jgi:hypothetical protein